MIQQFLDRTRRLADALLVLDEGEAHVTVAAFAEPDSGADRDIRVAREAGVAVSPGIGFGDGGDGHVRFALVENEQRIGQATRAIKKLLDH